jgi:hypothetical protein
MQRRIAGNQYILIKDNKCFQTNAKSNDFAFLYGKRIFAFLNDQQENSEGKGVAD